MSSLGGPTLNKNSFMSLNCLPSGLQSCFQAIWSFPLYKIYLIYLCSTHSLSTCMYTYNVPWIKSGIWLLFDSEVSPSLSSSGIRSTVIEGRLLSVHNSTTKPPRLDVIFSQQFWIWEGVRSKLGFRSTAKLLLPRCKLPPSSQLFH